MSQLGSNAPRYKCKRPHSSPDNDSRRQQSIPRLVCVIPGIFRRTIKNEAKACYLKVGLALRDTATGHGRAPRVCVQLDLFLIFPQLLSSPGRLASLYLSSVCPRQNVSPDSNELFNSSFARLFTKVVPKDAQAACASFGSIFVNSRAKLELRNPF